MEKNECQCLKHLGVASSDVCIRPAIIKNHLACLKHIVTLFPETLLWKNTDGVTLLHLAVIQQSIDCLEFLIPHCLPRIRAQTRWQKDTPLHFAAYKGCTRSAKLLLKAGASMIMENHSGRDALAAAIDSGHEDIVHLFLDHGYEEPRVSYRMTTVFHAHYRCVEATRLLLGILRKRFTIPSAAFPNGGYPLPLSLIQTMAKMVWETRKVTETWSVGPSQPSIKRSYMI